MLYAGRPSARRPSSFAKDWIQMLFSFVHMRCRYSNAVPVLGHVMVCASPMVMLEAYGEFIFAMRRGCMRIVGGGSGMTGVSIAGSLSSFGVFLVIGRCCAGRCDGVPMNFREIYLKMADRSLRAFRYSCLYVSVPVVVCSFCSAC